ncbi:unnamed protein product [Malus baccata var. baccata]
MSAARKSSEETICRGAHLVATQTSSSSTTTRPSLSCSEVAHFLKLTETNYLFWLSHMKPFLLGHHLFGYMDGTILAPATTLPIVDKEPAKPNPAFTMLF